jgi:7-cyano-7-deazaguanine tRNA-ribosyltransferase
VQDGVLWELVDDRCRGHPQLLRGFRTLLSHAGDLAAYDRVSKRRFFYRGTESCKRTEVLRYQSMLGRFTIGDHVLVAFDGRARPELGELFLFKPPFGPYPPELRETFPIGQSEIPDWDDEMVRQGCRGIAILAKTHPGTRLTVSCDTRWVQIVRSEVPTAEVIDNSPV